MKRDFKTGILLIFIGITATIGLTVITGKQAVSKNQTPNPIYGFGYCVYEMKGDIAGCYGSIKLANASG
jgi:hypothetical protein